MIIIKAKPLIFAHRGASNIAPENTLKAFKKAIELNADYIEFDIHQSKDSEIIVMHDSNTFRTTGHFGFIKNMTLEELKQLDCGDGERIPTIKELIQITKDKINLNCEIKSRGIAENLVEILRRADLIDNTIISSFKHEELLKVQKLEPRLKLASLHPSRVGWIRSWLSRRKLLKTAIKNKFYAINPFHKLLNEKLIIKAHKYNIKIFPWTVNSDSAIKRVTKLGVDGIITNKIFRVKEILNQLDS
ncbi:MAG: glycerophosphodiester phosphodiesterase [Promethearchaeota archaeon]